MYIIANWVAVSEILDQLALNPKIGSRRKAQELISTFWRDAALLSGACSAVAVRSVSASPRPGRPTLDWYDDFTAMLLEIASEAGVNPTLRRDRDTSAPSGWLLDAAQKLEVFLEPGMRSSNIVARAKRLERSRKRLGRPDDKNPPRANVLSM